MLQFAAVYIGGDWEAVRNRLLPIGILAAIMFALVGARLGPSSASAQTAQTPTPGLNFWIAVDGVPDCDTQSGDSTCDLALGGVFVIDTFLDPLPSDIPDYGGYDISIRHVGLTLNHDASTDAWPDCGFPAAGYDDPPITTDEVRFGCAVGVPPATESSYSGLIGTISFVCGASGSLTLLHGPSKTDLIENIAKIHFEDPNAIETLTINCVQGGVTPVPTTPRPGATGQPQATPLPPTEQAKATATAKAKGTATAAAKTPTGGNDSDGGLSGVVIAIIIVAVVIVAGGGGFFGWRYYQSRRGAGGGGT